MKDLASIFARVEATTPERQCARTGACCQFAVTGREPFVTHAEMELIVVELRRQGRKVPAPRPDDACPLLTPDGTRCSVYDARPMGCRTFFCREAGGVVTAREMRDPLHALNALEESRGKKKRPPRPLTRALEEARRGR